MLEGDRLKRGDLKCKKKISKAQRMLKAHGETKAEGSLSLPA